MPSGADCLCWCTCSSCCLCVTADVLGMVGGGLCGKTHTEISVTNMLITEHMKIRNAPSKRTCTQNYTMVYINNTLVMKMTVYTLYNVVNPTISHTHDMWRCVGTTTIMRPHLKARRRRDRHSLHLCPTSVTPRWHWYNVRLTLKCSYHSSCSVLWNRIDKMWEVNYA